MKSPQRKFRVLALDGDPFALETTVAILKADQALEVYRAKNTAEAALLAEGTGLDLIVSAIPDPSESADFMLRVKQKCEAPAPSFLVVYDEVGIPDMAKGLEQGTDDYIERRLLRKLLLPKVWGLLRSRALWDELAEDKKQLETANEQLERNFKELISILLKIVEVRIPGASDRAEMAKAAVEFLGRKLTLTPEQQKVLIFAALLHELGKVGLPDEVANKHYITVLQASARTFQQYATVGSMILMTVTGFKESADDVYHQLENYDGTGFPDGLMGEEIPFGARILRAIVFAEEYYAEGHSTESVTDKIRVAMHKFLDPQVANPLIEFLMERSRKDHKGKLKLPVDGLKGGMVVADDVYASSGIKLLPKGVRLQEKMIALLMERNKTDPIVGGVYIVVGN